MVLLYLMANKLRVFYVNVNKYVLKALPSKHQENFNIGSFQYFYNLHEADSGLMALAQWENIYQLKLRNMPASQ